MANLDPFKQIELLRKQSASFRPDLYKLYALYLQFLRESLPNVVHQSVIELINISSNHLSDMPEKSFQVSFQAKVDELVNKACSLITIEHLIDLANTVEKEQKHYLDNIKNQLAKEEQNNSELLEESKPTIESIELGLGLPISEKLDIDIWDTSNTTQFQSTNSVNRGKDTGLPLNSNDSVVNDIEYSPGINSRNDMDIFKSIFSMAGDIFASNNNTKKTNDDISGDSKATLNDDLSTSSLLPEMPEEIFHWANSIETSLVIRLRNLSHLINIELLRIGLINSYIPTSLFEGVLSGQIQSLHAPSNILKIRIPLQDNAVDASLDVLCIFVRPSELEFDNFKLRQCRQKIIDQRKKLSKMVRQQRYWSKRSLAKEVKENWWQIPLK
ncbi:MULTISPECIES: hypothetical protein [Prochlorococcus]|uniref:hypothetical protein n=1 Tax=Prochlorococcus TaxID=1218 RepID=UPI0005337BBB|nr:MULTISPECIES: hypothetical protein [Prochlorococcus]KGG12336.1 putative Adenylate cyclase [Prochlorococcus sp. MIT 0601]